MESESEIAKRLEKNIQTDIPAPNDEPSPLPTAPPPDKGFTDDMGDSLDLYRLYDYFEVDTSYRNRQNEDRLQTIWRWAADKLQTTDYLRIVDYLGHIDLPNGSEQFTTNRLERMYRYVQLDKQMDVIRKEQAMLYGR